MAQDVYRQRLLSYVQLLNITEIEPSSINFTETQKSHINQLAYQHPDTLAYREFLILPARETERLQTSGQMKNRNQP
jgi:hypothetical protein